MDLETKKQGKKDRRIKPARWIALGFACIILIGALLLTLPIMTKERVWTNFVDALFTATTSVCVTGLVVETTAEYWSVYGQMVILVLIQLGGFGVVTVMMSMFLAMKRRISLSNRVLMQESFNSNSIAGLVRLTINVLKGTILVEGIGAILYAFCFVPEYGIVKGIWISIFNAVSAFCNAGIDIIGTDSLAGYITNPLINFVTMGLIFMGGLGFIVWFEVVRVIREMLEKKKSKKAILKSMNLHTKIVLSMTACLILGGAAFIFIFEYTNPATIGNLSLPNKIMASLFQSVTTRTAGFFTIPQEAMRDNTSLVCIILMFIGGSPVGTAGGVKTVTIAVLLFSALSIIKSQDETVIFRRRITEDSIKKALAVLLVSFSALLLITMGVCITEDADFMTIVYETTSAIATVGLSKAFTGSLSVGGRILIILAMYIGRIGPITMVVACNTKGNKKRSISVPEGNITIG